MRRLVLVVLALLLATTACGVPQDDEPRVLGPADVPFGLPSPTPAPDTAGDGRVPLYFVRNGQVVLATRPVESSTPSEELLDLLFRGTTTEEREAGLLSVIPASLRVEDLEEQGGTAVVTLGGSDEQVLRTQPLAFAQIVATLTASNRFTDVRFRLEDADLPVLTGDGSLSDRPLDRSDYEGLIATAAPAAPSPSA